MQNGLKVVRTSMITILLWRNEIMSVSGLKTTAQIIGKNVTPIGIWISIQGLTIRIWSIVATSITRNTSVAMNVIPIIVMIIVGISTVAVMIGETITITATATVIMGILTLMLGVPINTATPISITCKRDRVRLSCALV